MPARVHIGAADIERVDRHLATGDDEQLVFLLARWSGDDAHVVDLRPVPATGFDLQLPWHLSLADEERARVIKWAHDADAALIEAHVHRDGDPAEFSPSDIRGLAEFVPHVWWRLRHRPYVALVFGQKTFDGLAWRSSPEAREPLDAVVVDGARREPTGLSYARRSRGGRRPPL